MGCGQLRQYSNDDEEKARICTVVNEYSPRIYVKKVGIRIEHVKKRYSEHKYGHGKGRYLEWARTRTKAKV